MKKRSKLLTVWTEWSGRCSIRQGSTCPWARPCVQWLLLCPRQAAPPASAQNSHFCGSPHCFQWWQLCQAKLNFIAKLQCPPLRKEVLQFLKQTIASIYFNMRMARHCPSNLASANHLGSGSSSYRPGQTEQHGKVELSMPSTQSFACVPPSRC